MRYHDILSEGRDAYLFHGTDLVGAIEILRSNKLIGTQQYSHNPFGVSLTRDYRIARDFATYWERQFPVVFVLDQRKLVQSRAKLLPRRDSFESGYVPPREAEKMILGDLHNLSEFLISVNVHPAHIKEALSDEEYQEWMMDEREVGSREQFIEGIKELARYPKLNAWLPRVQWAKGTEQIPKLDEDIVDYDSVRKMMKAAGRICSDIHSFVRDLPIRVTMKPDIRYGNCHGIEINELYADEPGSGAGTILMKEILRLADNAGLNVYTNAEGPSSTEFYKKFGFESDRQGRHQLVWYPDLGPDYNYLKESVNEALYHVTFSSRVPKIKSEGIVPGKRRNWERAMGGKYGEIGHIYLFTSEESAARWAAKMEWEFKKPTSILVLRGVEAALDDDPSGESQLMLNGSGTWKRTQATVPPQCIERAIPLTTEIKRKIVDVTNGSTDAFSLTESAGQWPSELDADGLIDFMYDVAPDDDDEFPSREWLENILHGADGAVLKTLPLRGLKNNGGYMSANKLHDYEKLDSAAPPIIVNPITKTIVDGNHRARLARKRGEKTIAAYVLFFNDDEPL
jgi:hypothetical protein